MSHTIMFYNLENLYDSTANSDGKDTEFTPAGSKRWTSDRYYSRLNNLSEVFAAVASAHGGFPAVAGVSEVENLSVLKTLASRKNMAARIVLETTSIQLRMEALESSIIPSPMEYMA